MVGTQVGTQVGTRVRTQVGTQVRTQVRTQVEGNYENLTPPLLCRKAKEKKRGGKGCLMKLLRD